MTTYKCRMAPGDVVNIHMPKWLAEALVKRLAILEPWEVTDDSAVQTDGDACIVFEAIVVGEA